MNIDYDSLIDRPRINGHVLTGNMSSEELDIQGGSGNVDDVLVNGQSVVDEFKIAKIKSYKEVTQAEYNALPATKTEDGVMYCITDAHGADGYPPLIYSDEEREVGVWRDGKPLYEKTIITTTASAVSTDKVIGDATGLNIVNISQFRCGWTYDNYSGYIYDIYTSEKVQLYTDGDDIIESHSTANANDQQLIYTIQYTKDSDTAGSGTWTTQGAYAHHYSTDEHVVGTWVDGKPIYEKVVDMGQNIMCDSGLWTNTTEPNAGKDKIINAHAMNANGTVFLCIGVNADTGSYMQILNTRNAAIGVRYLTVQYTKTTD